MNKSTTTSLQKVIFSIMSFIVGLIVLLLALLDGYMIRNYQMTIRAEWKDTLNRYAEDVKNDLSEINSDLYDIYYYDPNFRSLNTASGVQALPYVHELADRLQTQVLLKRKAAGYLLLFDELKKKRYFFARDTLPNAEIEELKRSAEEFSRAESSFRGWYYIEINEKGYAIGTYRDKGISLSVFYCLEDICISMEEELSDIEAKVFFEHNRTVLGSAEKDEINDSELEYSDREVNGTYFYRAPVRKDDLTLHLEVPMHLLSYLNFPQILIMAISILGIIITVLFYRRLKKELFTPMDTLIADMRRIGGGDWSSGIHSQSRFMEVQQVIETTDRMIDEIETQKLLTYEKTIQEQQARMQYLSLQVNPHFYLNGLKTLNVLAMKGDNERIQTIIFTLSGYLRYLLQLENELVTLEEELAFVQNYIELYREMLEREIDVNLNIREDTKKCLVPRLGIQTFVENSFKYAKLGNKDSSLSIGISAERFSSEEGEYLEIIVRDNGNGYDETLLAVLNDAPTEGNVSVGISNLKRRCMFLYDKDTQYAFYNDGGAVSDIFLPWIQRE